MWATNLIGRGPRIPWNWELLGMLWVWEKTPIFFGLCQTFLIQLEMVCYWVSTCRSLPILSQGNPAHLGLSTERRPCRFGTHGAFLLTAAPQQILKAEPGGSAWSECEAGYPRFHWNQLEKIFTALEVRYETSRHLAKTCQNNSTDHPFCFRRHLEPGHLAHS
jgi:hypothetical protein